MADNEFFQDPNGKPTDNETSSNVTPDQTKVQSDPIPDTGTQNVTDYLDYWETETEHREKRRFQANDDPVDEESGEPEFDEMPLDAEAAEFAADLAVNANQEGASRLLKYLHGEGKIEDYRASNESLLRKAWYRFFEMMNIQISKEKGVLWANLLTFGWSLGIGIWKFIGRVVSGAFRWPWSKKPEPPEIERLMESEQSPEPAPVPPPPSPEPTDSDGVEFIELDPWADTPFNICLHTSEKFHPGTGFPKTKTHEYYDKFIDRGAWQGFLEHQKRDLDNG